jgi:hypothetical protein
VAAGTAAQFLDLYALYGDGQGANPKGLIEYALADYEMQAETNSVGSGRISNPSPALSARSAKITARSRPHS